MPQPDEMEVPKPLVLGTGDYPGAGASTSFRLLADVLGVPYFDAGRLRRKFAFMWSQYLDDNRVLSPTEEHWLTFDRLINSYLHDEPEKVFTITETPSQLNNDDQLNRFSRAQETLCHNGCVAWDMLPEQFLAFNLHQHGVVNGDLSILITQINELKELLPKGETDDAFYVLLTAGISVTAERTFYRENTGFDKSIRFNRILFPLYKLLFVLQNARRVRADWLRWQKTYHITDKDGYTRGIKPGDLHQVPDQITIDTSHLTPPQVVYTILDQMCQREPSLTILSLKLIKQLYQQRLSQT